MEKKKEEEKQKKSDGGSLLFSLAAIVVVAVVVVHLKKRIKKTMADCCRFFFDRVRSGSIGFNRVAFPRPRFFTFGSARLLFLFFFLVLFFFGHNFLFGNPVSSISLITEFFFFYRVSVQQTSLDKF